MAKRIALFAISSSASKYKKSIIPLFSFNADFYIRLFLIVKDSPEECKLNALKYGYVFHCRNCQNRTISPLAEKEKNKIKFKNNTSDKLCKICDSNMTLSGPFWIDDLHDYDFLDNLITNLQKEEFKYLKYNSRILNFLNLIKEESVLKHCIFTYDYSRFGNDINLSIPKLSLIR
jgi:tRNA (guanine26-N2/guanine27-N2)-dimethyltransferase